MQLNETLNELQLHNYQSLKISISEFWNVEEFTKLLEGYHDQELLTFVKYGWPISHDGKHGNHKRVANWGGSINHAEKV